MYFSPYNFKFEYNYMINIVLEADLILRKHYTF